MKNRNGSYKKILMDEDSLKKEAPFIIEGIRSLRKKSMSDQDFTTLYILFFLRLNQPKNYLQRHTKKIIENHDNDFQNLLNIIPQEFELSTWEIEKLKGITGPDLFQYFNLRGIPKSIHRAMINWYNNSWDIKMLFTIPSPAELLFMQVENSRVLTLIIDEKKLTTHILGRRDPLSFALHDLMHADQFFNNPKSQKGQLGFYKWIATQYQNPILQNKLQCDKKFKDEFDYVVSDMNAYVMHLLKSFKSCFTRAHCENIFEDLCLNFNFPVSINEAIKKINYEDIPIEEEIKIVTFFENIQEVLI